MKFFDKFVLLFLFAAIGTSLFGLSQKSQLGIYSLDNLKEQGFIEYLEEEEIKELETIALNIENSEQINQELLKDLDLVFNKYFNKISRIPVYFLGILFEKGLDYAKTLDYLDILVREEAAPCTYMNHLNNFISFLIIKAKTSQSSDAIMLIGERFLRYLDDSFKESDEIIYRIGVFGLFQLNRVEFLNRALAKTTHFIENTKKIFVSLSQAIQIYFLLEIFTKYREQILTSIPFNEKLITLLNAFKNKQPFLLTERFIFNIIPAFLEFETIFSNIRSRRDTIEKLKRINVLTEIFKSYLKILGKENRKQFESKMKVLKSLDSPDNDTEYGIESAKDLYSLVAEEIKKNYSPIRRFEKKTKYYIKAMEAKLEKQKLKKKRLKEEVGEK